MTVRVRIAPSPTGNLHIGTARTAVFNWLFARHYGGTFILRIEDTDLERSRPEFTQNILDGLSWLGLNWDEGPFFQSQRSELYRQYLQLLLDKGLAYRAYETPAELEALRSSQKANHQAPRYDNRHRSLTPEQRSAYEAEGRQCVIRFIIDDFRDITWNDGVRGQIAWKGQDLGGDMVIARAAPANEIGLPLYNFVVVIDDIAMNISHVIRGEDHIGNTPKQILLYEALGALVPQFAHTPLILNSSGAKLSKRDGVTSISDFQSMGYVSGAIANYMSLLGWSPPEPMTEQFSLVDAATHFSFDRVNRSGAKFDWDKLNWLNSHYLHKLSITQLTDLLIPIWEEAGYEFHRDSERQWLEQLTALLSASLVRLTDGVDLARPFLAKELEFNESAVAQLRQPQGINSLKYVISQLPAAPLTLEMAQALIQQVVQVQGLKKGLVMKTMRAALTGELQGPDLLESWVLLNQRKVDLKRLEQALMA
ncbi:MAG: glutamate--tRNA ligase [Synechococcales bacterium]|nr:glutamate--tRNA ligase [Synechococcales bacterium]